MTGCENLYYMYENGFKSGEFLPFSLFLQNDSFVQLFPLKKKTMKRKTLMWGKVINFFFLLIAILSVVLLFYY